MAQVELLAQRAFGERRPWLLTIVAPPGTGKSRLLAEFIDRLPAIAPDATVVVAHCLPYGQRLAYQPLRTVLHELVGRPEGTPPAELLDAATAWLDESGVADARRTAGLLGATIGLPTTEPPVESELLAAWRTFFEAAAARHPLIIAFDDLHWSSDCSSTSSTSRCSPVRTCRRSSSASPAPSSSTDGRRGHRAVATR
jgi:predicted ATPase